MIGYVKGTIKEIYENSILVVFNGLGWEIKTTYSDFLINTEVEMFIHTHVRENEISLWGFRTAEELKLFRMLLDVSGVGPKTASNLVVNKGITGIVNAIMLSDATGLKVQGVGQKTADKIALELRGKIDGFSRHATSKDSALPNTIDQGKVAEVTEALIALGYKNIDIINSLNALDKKFIKDSDVGDIIKEVLKTI